MHYVRLVVLIWRRQKQVVHNQCRKEGIMTTLQNIAVYLWLAPVLILVVFPLLWSLFRAIYRMADRSRLADVRGYVVAGTAESDKRHRDRILVEEGWAYVDAECDCCKAAVSNISEDGICLKHIAPSIGTEPEQLRVVFRTRQKDYDLTAKPKWKHLTDEGYEIGAEIEGTPPGWNSLVEGFVPRMASSSARAL
jgi:hypothetical protein